MIEVFLQSVLSKMMKNWLVKRLMWFVFRKIMRSWLIGVYTVVFNGNNEILLIKKRLGMSTGWQIPGGGKQRWVSFPKQAKKELWEEAGITGNLKLVGVRSNEEHIDVHIIYAGYITGKTEPCPQDKIEISDARFFSIGEAKKILPEDQRKMLSIAITNLLPDTYM